MRLDNYFYVLLRLMTSAGDVGKYPGIGKDGRTEVS